MVNQNLWQSVLTALQAKISKPSFSTWLSGISVRSLDQGTLCLAVPNIFVKEWIQTRMEKDILEVISQFVPDIKKIKYAISQQGGESKNSKKQIALDITQPKIEFLNQKAAGLNPKYTFQNFVVGEFNQLAHACAIATVQRWKGGKNSPSLLKHTYNPLFIYSRVGLGKTHLLEAIGNELVKSKRRLKVKYIPCSNFTSKIIASIRGGNAEVLSEEYQVLDILIIDDIEFLAGKERTQDIFFRIFNSAIERDKQIVLSSDRPPKAIEEIEERIRSRFEGGMIADISTPSFEERLAILETKLNEKEALLPLEILEFIAKHLKDNIRELEGGLIKALIIFEKEKSVAKTIEKLKDIVSAFQKRLSVARILEVVCEFYGLKKEEILSPVRKKELVLARQTAMYFLREKLKLSLPSIGIKMGNKDHTTVRYGCEKIGEKLKKDLEFQKEIEVIEERLEQG